MLGDPPALDKWYYHWASPFGFFLLLLGFGLCGVALCIGGRTKQTTPGPQPEGTGESAGQHDARGNEGDGKLVELRTNYWLKRLDHTLTHTQNSSRLIYVVDGAVLALLYFSLQTFGTSRQVILLAALPTLLLAVLNLFHARLIVIQQSWYHGIDGQLRKLLNQPRVEHQPKRYWFGSTHGIYRGMHMVIALFLALLAILMFLYGLGWFPEIKVPQGAPQSMRGVG
jgi:hypothetical protein